MMTSTECQNPYAPPEPTTVEEWDSLPTMWDRHWSIVAGITLSGALFGASLSFSMTLSFEGLIPAFFGAIFGWILAFIISGAVVACTAVAADLLYHGRGFGAGGALIIAGICGAITAFLSISVLPILLLHDGAIRLVAAMVFGTLGGITGELLRAHTEKRSSTP